MIYIFNFLGYLWAVVPSVAMSHGSVKMKVDRFVHDETESWSKSSSLSMLVLLLKHCVVY